jgi:PadR family transcriptional regulator PadR
MVATTPRLTYATLTVVNALLTDPVHQWYGLEVVKATPLPSGTVYPILARMERHGWLSSTREQVPADARTSRPPRRYYTLTDQFPYPKAEA